MPRVLGFRYHARIAAVVGLCIAASLLSAPDSNAQTCNVQIDRSVGGTLEGQTSAGLVFDSELEIEVAPDLSTVRLENSIIRAVYTTLPVPPEL